MQVIKTQKQIVQKLLKNSESDRKTEKKTIVWNNTLRTSLPILDLEKITCQAVTGTTLDEIMLSI